MGMLVVCPYRTRLLRGDQMSFAPAAAICWNSVDSNAAPWMIAVPFAKRPFDFRIENSCLDGASPRIPSAICTAKLFVMDQSILPLNELISRMKVRMWLAG